MVHSKSSSFANLKADKVSISLYTIVQDYDQKKSLASGVHLHMSKQSIVFSAIIALVAYLICGNRFLFLFFFIFNFIFIFIMKYER